MKTALTIAGSDCSGGAGIQADIKTMTVHKVYAMSVVTALTAQNTTGVYGIFDASPEFIADQLDCVFTDIFPDAVKIGMVSNIEIIKIIAKKLRQYKAANIVLDPVMVAASGGKLLNDDAVETVINELFPIADIITPNIPEAEFLSGVRINGPGEMQRCAEALSAMLKTGGAVLIKGGHFDGGNSDDLLYMDNTAFWLRDTRVDTKNAHGTGCTLSSAIACNLAFGCDIYESAKLSKDYVCGALKAGLDLGRGCGPLNHAYRL